MTQDERRLWLIRYLLDEQSAYHEIEVPEDIEGQRSLLRALMNVRMPLPISDGFLEIQDAYLKERSCERGIEDASDLVPTESDDRLCIWQGDITTLKIDAIVNACNSQMLGCFRPLHGCIDNIIHTYAGVELRLKMNDIMLEQGHEEPVGQAKITSGYNLPAKFILHTVGPTVQWRVTARDRHGLASCYRSCLALAAERGAESVAFCCISTGVYRFPQDQAAQIAVAAVKDFLDADSRIKRVVFNVFKDEDLGIYRNLLQASA